MDQTDKTIQTIALDEVFHIQKFFQEVPENITQTGEFGPYLCKVIGDRIENLTSYLNHFKNKHLVVKS